MARSRKKILFTGSGGFIGSNFIRQAFFEKKPYTFCSIDRVRESHLLHNVFINTNHSFYMADIEDTHILTNIFNYEKPDIVIHGAAVYNGPQLISSNISGTQNLIDLCVAGNIKLILLGDDCVYGNNSTGMLKETSDINPQTTYAAIRASAEFLIKTASISQGLKYNILRLGNTYGPWQTIEDLIPQTVRVIIDKEKIPLLGNGQQVREWTHVFDTCSAIFAVIDTGVDNEVYNITSNQEFMAIEVVQSICNAIGSGFEFMKFVEDGASDRRTITSDKIKSLGWKPEYKLKDGISQTVQWYLNNQFCLRI